MSASGQPSVALIVLDTLRKDTFDGYFDWLSGRRFENAYSTANWTTPSHASLFGGLYASELGVHSDTMHFDSNKYTLVESLSESGYETRAFSANPNVSGHFNFDRGFDEFQAPSSIVHLSHSSLVDWNEFSQRTSDRGILRYPLALRECLQPEYDTIASFRAGFSLLLEDRPSVLDLRGARDALEHVRDWDFGSPSFLFCNLMEVHEPYIAPDAYQTVPEPDLHSSVGDISLTDVNGDQTRQAYQDCANYLSDAYQDLFEALQEEFDYVITLSDHGELLGEGDAWGHEHGVRPELTHVPLVVSGEGLDGTCDATVSLLDVHRTVLDLAGVDAPSRGQNILEDPGGEYLTEYLGLTEWSRETLDENFSSDVVEQYDATLRGIAAEGEYGFETVDGFQRVGEEQSAATESRLSRLVEQLDERDVDGEAISADVRDHLANLGYQ